DQSYGWGRLEFVLQNTDANFDPQHLLRFGLDQQVATRVAHARVLWLQGFPDQAKQAASRCVAMARKLNHINSLCVALTDGACTIAAGDLEATDKFAGELTEFAGKHNLGLWYANGLAFRTWVRSKRSDPQVGIELLRGSIQQWRADLRHATFVSSFAEM